MDYRNVEFVKTAVDADGYPKENMPEIAVVGRSNVGKSAMLNNLFGRKNMVKTSSVPGKTQALQFFCVDEKLMVVDLPGYGYAKAPKKDQARWAQAIEEYLTSREDLELILFLLDIRRDPSAHDLLFVEFANHHQLPFKVIITKADKIKRGQRKGRIDVILKEIPHVDYALYSTEEKLGRREVIRWLDDIIA